MLFFYYYVEKRFCRKAHVFYYFFKNTPGKIDMKNMKPGEIVTSVITYGYTN